MYLDSAQANTLHRNLTETATVGVEMYVCGRARYSEWPGTPVMEAAKWVYCTESNGGPCLHYGSWDDLDPLPLLSVGYVLSFLMARDITAENCGARCVFKGTI